MVWKTSAQLQEMSKPSTLGEENRLGEAQTRRSNQRPCVFRVKGSETENMSELITLCKNVNRLKLSG